MEIRQGDGQLLVKTKSAILIIDDEFVTVMLGLDQDDNGSHAVEIDSSKVVVDPGSNREHETVLSGGGKTEYFTISFDDKPGQLVAVHESQMRSMGKEPSDPSQN